VHLQPTLIFFLCRSALVALPVLAMISIGDAARAASCSEAPPPVTSLNVSRYYADADGTVVDPALHAQHEAAVEPLTAFLRHVVSDADHAWTRTAPKGRAEASTCALAWLTTWAQGGAWLGSMSTKQAEYQRKWDLAGVALAYLKVRRFARIEQQKIIDPWLQKWADIARAFFDDAERKRNNHWYWLGLGVAAVALATDSPRHWDMARGIMRDAARDIRADGTLPEEMARGPRALFYHVFSVMPLVLLAELGATRGEDWYRLGDGALHRLVATTIGGLNDIATFDALAHVRQERPVNTRAGWLQAYQRRFPERLPTQLPTVADRHRWLGGHVGVLLDALRR
jgi:poly(beta-D-mannuronate) lyase